jgi:N utilization substance protein B
VIDAWTLNDDYILLLLNAIKASKFYTDYMKNQNLLEEDRQLIVDLFMEVIAPNEKLYEYLEDDKLTWIDDTIGKHANH